MKKQTLLALSAGIAIITSSVTFANTQTNHTFNSNSSSGTVITGYSDDASDQQNPAINNQDQSNSQTGTFKRKASGKTFNNNRNNSQNSSNNTNNSTSTDQNS
jgi:hypothetical protein